MLIPTREEPNKSVEKRERVNNILRIKMLSENRLTKQKLRLGSMGLEKISI